MNVVAYVDGSCFPNPGSGGWGLYLEAGDERVEFGGHVPNTTNNEMEFQAILEALAYIFKTYEINGVVTPEVTIYSDSQIAVNVMNGHWRCKARNLKPIYAKAKEYLPAFQDLKIAWVKGHHLSAGNIRADRIAVGYSIGRRLPEPTSYRSHALPQTQPAPGR